MSVPALFFDLDGTLADTEPVHWRAWRASLQRFGIDLTWPDFERLGVGVPDGEMTAIFRREYPGVLDHASDHDLCQGKDEAFESSSYADVFHPDTLLLLEELRDHPKALVTMSSRHAAEALLRSARLWDAFHAHITVNDVERPKPHPEPYLRAMQMLNVDSGIAFEDSQRGIASATAAGLDVVAVSKPALLRSLAIAKLESYRTLRT